MVDWKKFKASLDPDELRNYEFILMRIRHWKEIKESADSFRILFVGQSPTCEKHWFSNCYECSPIKSLDVIIQKASKKLAGLRFLLRGMLLKHGFIEAPTVLPPFIPMERPLDVVDYGKRADSQFWDSNAGNFRSSPLRGGDVQDNLTLQIKSLEAKLERLGD